MNRQWLAAVAAAGLLIVTPAAALDPPDEMLGLYYAWRSYVDECAGRSPDVTAEIHDAVHKTAQDVEQMVLNSRPDAERDEFRRKASDFAAKALAELKRQAGSDKDICDNVRMALASWSIYSTNLRARIKDLQQMQLDRR
jgi:hypothetical protein